MFRPNRVGTPVIHQLAAAAVDTSAWVPNAEAIGTMDGTGNTMNGTPQLDFGEDKAYWSGASKTFANNTKFCLFHQVTITEPNQGDCVGIEINASIWLNADKNIKLVPIFARLNTSGLSLFANVQTQPATRWTNFGTTNIDGPTTDTQDFLSYKEQFIIQQAPIAGTYGHGFQLINTSGSAAAINAIVMTASVRQWNDQQQVGYRDIKR